MIFDGNLIRRFLRSRFSHGSLGAVGVELLVNFFGASKPLEPVLLPRQFNPCFLKVSSGS